MSEPQPPVPHPLSGLRTLLDTVARLRGPGGCPWDRAQTLASLSQHLVEEAFEAAEALRTGDLAGAREELGDILVNVALCSEAAREQGAFDLDAVAGAAAQKLVRRHPHVFGDGRVDGAEAALAGWERLKLQERKAAGGPRGVLDGVPRALPALLRAFRLGEKAARVGFDWPDREGPRRKLDEELAELDAAVAAGDAPAIAAEFGDVLFSLCNLARHLGVHPERALAGTADKFQRRFASVEAQFGHELAGRSLAELDAAWNRAKLAEHQADDAGPTA